MRVLLRNVLTGLFVAENGEWVEDREGARDFERSFEALKFGQSLGSKHMELVFSFGSPQFDVTIPVLTTPRSRPESPPDRPAAR